MNCLLFFLIFFQNKELSFETTVFLEDAFDIQTMDAEKEVVALLAKSTPYVRIYNSKGVQLAAWGQFGHGPSEISLGCSIAIDSNSVWVLDRSPPKIMQFNFNGQLIKTLKLDMFILSARVDAGGGRVFVQGGGWLQPVDQLYSLVPGEKRKIRDVKLGLKTKLKNPHGASYTIPRPYSERDLWSVMGDGTLTYIEKGSSIVMYQGKNGKLGYGWGFESKKYAVTKPAVKKWLNRFFPGLQNEKVNAASWLGQARRIPPPKYYPPAIRMITDDTDIWLLRSIGIETQLWERYVSGSLAGKIHLPIDFDVITIGNTQCYALESKEEPRLLKLNIR
ncbi:MAG: hypothetical protein QNK37_19510 [Acidobacteriota bacterium]|nr:hypothetical protein [Acidobacteriota bacterium]